MKEIRDLSLESDNFIQLKSRLIQNFATVPDIPLMVEFYDKQTKSFKNKHEIVSDESILGAISIHHHHHHVI